VGIGRYPLAMTLLDGQLHPTEQHLLDHLGSRDPVESQLDTLAAWTRMIDEAPELMAVPPAPGEWSAVEVLGHLAAVELTNGLRYRAMLVAEAPNLDDYGQPAWGSLWRSAPVDTVALLALFAGLRRANVEFWHNLDDAGRKRIGLHPECGPETIELRFRMLAGHDRMHLAQAERAIEAVRSSRG
jgi:hypothetical protein